MIVENENLLTIGQAAKSQPNRRGTRGVHIATVWRWIVSGCRGQKLETVLIGGIRFTSREAIERFHAAINGESVTATPVDRQRAIERAERVCAAAKI